MARTKAARSIRSPSKPTKPTTEDRPGEWDVLWLLQGEVIASTTVRSAATKESALGIAKTQVPAKHRRLADKVEVKRAD
jgi:hypothetical protein